MVVWPWYSKVCTFTLLVLAPGMLAVPLPVKLAAVLVLLPVWTARVVVGVTWTTEGVLVEDDEDEEFVEVEVFVEVEELAVVEEVEAGGVVELLPPEMPLEEVEPLGEELPVEVLSEEVLPVWPFAVELTPLVLLGVELLPVLLLPVELLARDWAAAAEAGEPPHPTVLQRRIRVAARKAPIPSFTKSPPATLRPGFLVPVLGAGTLEGEVIVGLRQRQSTVNSR